MVLVAFFSSFRSYKMYLHIALFGFLIIVQPIQTFKFPWAKTTVSTAALGPTPQLKFGKPDKVDLEALVGYNSTWCAYAYNHTFPDEYEMEYLKIKLCTNSSDADRIDAILRFEALVEERSSVDQLMTNIITKLADNDKQKIDFLTADPFGIPTEKEGCYADVTEDFSQICLDFELNPYVNRFRNVFVHACEADWINPKSKIKYVFEDVCSRGTSSTDKLKNAEKVDPINLRMYEDVPSGAVQGVNSSSFYNAFISMTSDDYVYETLQEQSRSGYGSPDSQVAEARAAYKLILKKRLFVNQLITQLLTILSDYDGEKRAKLTDDNFTIHHNNMKCYMTVLQDFSRHCLDLQLNPYAKRFRNIFVHICEANWLSTKKVHDIFERTCQTTDKRNTAIVTGTF